MDGFKNSTRVQYMKGGSCEGYAKGGSVKGAAKIAKVMGEFKAGTLHSGSKKGPEVTSKKQATAIALSEARKAGAKIPMKKAHGGPVKMFEGGTYNERGKRATMAEIAAEDRRMANRKPPVEGVSSRPTDSSGRRASNADLGMAVPAKKPVAKGAAPRGMGAMSDREMQMLKAAAAKKGVPAHSGKPMIRRKTGGLTAMPKGKC
jgi:hypothetical protein